MRLPFEGAEPIAEVGPADPTVSHRLAVQRVSQGQTVMAEGGRGIGAATIAPQPGHAGGATLLVANQSFAMDDLGDPPAAFEVPVPPVTAPEPGWPPARIVPRTPLGTTNLQGLHRGI